MQRHWILLGAGLFLGLAGIIVYSLLQPYTLKGSAITTPTTAPDFILSSSLGGNYQLSQHNGKIRLLFFGYTTCPDICPATLSEMKQLTSRLGKQANEVQVLFVTVDPERDTLEKLSRYMAAFNPAFIGLSGTPDQLETVWKSYGVYREIRQGATAAGYLVDHTARVYGVDKKGNLRVTYSFGTPVDAILSDVRYLLRE